VTEPKHDGETFAQAVDRLSDNLEDPFDRHRKSRGRIGWKDLPHSVTNIPVTLARERPWLAGHLWLYTVLGLLTVIALGAAVWALT
jgi:hypothetical protein